MAADWDYDPAAESRDVARLRPWYGAVVDGRSVDGGGAVLPFVDAYTGDTLGEIRTASIIDADTAVASARRGAWAALRGAERARALFRLADLVRDRAAELAVVETLDRGAPIRAIRDVDLPVAADILFSAAGWADKLEYAGVGAEPRPVGVVAHLIAARAPLLATARALGPALAAGCSVVLAVAGSVSPIVLAELCIEAGLPPDAVQALPGDLDISTALVAHDGVDAVAASGPGAVRWARTELVGSGRRLVAASPEGPPTVVVVYDDAPLDQAVDGIVQLFGGRGAGGRVVVQESIVDELVAAVRSRAAALRIGDPLDHNTDIGVVRPRSRRRLHTELVEAAVADGAELWTSPHSSPGEEFTAPHLLTGVSPTMRIAYGALDVPVLPVLTFRTPDEAITVADATKARTATVWTDKGSRALWTANRLSATTVQVNAADAADPSPGIEAYLRA